VADRTIVLATNKRHAVRGLTVVNPQEFSAYQEDNDDLTYIVDMSSYLDGATISSVTRTPTGVTVTNTSNTTTRITQRLKGFGYVDFKVTTSSGDVEEFRLVIQQRASSSLQQIAQVPDPMPVAYTEVRDPTNADDTIDNFVPGSVWINTVSGNVFDCITNAQGAAIWRHRPRVLGQSGTTASITGTTAETTLATVVVPAAAMGASGALRITTLWQYTNSANNKTLRVNFGGTAFLNNSATTTLATQTLTIIRNRTASTQIGFTNATFSAIGTTTGTLATSSADTSASQSLTITAQLANSGETASLESYTVELIRPDIT